MRDNEFNAWKTRAENGIHRKQIFLPADEYVIIGKRPIVGEAYDLWEDMEDE